MNMHLLPVRLYAREARHMVKVFRCWNTDIIYKHWPQGTCLLLLHVRKIIAAFPHMHQEPFFFSVTQSF